MLSRAGLDSIYTTLIQTQLRWAGHVVRMSEQRLPKRLSCGELQQGRRSRGGQKKRFKDTLKVSLEAFQIDPDCWDQTAMDRTVWRHLLHKGSELFEAKQKSTAEQKRQAGKTRADDPPTAPNSPVPDQSVGHAQEDLKILDVLGVIVDSDGQTRTLLATGLKQV